MKRGEALKLLVFDFDGTLADTKKRWFYSILKVLRREKLYCPECEAKVIVHFGKKIKDILKVVDIPENKAVKISKDIYTEFLKKKPKKTADFSFLRKIKCSKIILSNSPSKVIRKLLGEDLRYFDKVYGEENFDNKVLLIKSLKKKYKLKHGELAYVGDRAGDVLTAREAGCLSIIVINKYSWNSRKEIIKEKPDITLKKIEDLRLYFNSAC